MIDLDDVTKVYNAGSANEVTALDGVTLHVEKGLIHGIVGQSGAGKSTLIRCLTALSRPTSGKIVIDGVDTSTLSGKSLRSARRHIGMVFQAANLLEARTAAANIAYPLQLAKWPRKQIASRVEELLALVGLEGRGSSYPSQLSGGQKQRVGIARAMATNPPVLLCDEPTSALDSASTEQILQLLEELRQKADVTILVITHEMRVVREICDSVTLLRSGKVVQSGTLSEVLTNFGSPLARELMPRPSIDGVQLDEGQALLDVNFSSSPGVPTGASVLKLAASLGADVAAGRFESFGDIQVGRLALAVPKQEVESVIQQLQQSGVKAEAWAA